MSFLHWGQLMSVMDFNYAMETTGKYIVLQEEEVKHATEGTGIPCETRTTNLPSTTILPRSRATHTITTKYQTIWNSNFKKFGIQMFLVFRCCSIQIFGTQISTVVVNAIYKKFKQDSKFSFFTLQVSRRWNCKKTLLEKY